MVASVVAALGILGAAVADGLPEAVLLTLSLVAGGIALAAAWRWRDQAMRRADEAAAREREARVLAEAASALLAAPATSEAVAPRLERALAEVGARLEISHAPAPQSREVALPLRTDGTSGWLYVDRNGPISRDDAERLLGAVSGLVGASNARARVDEAAAEAEAKRQADLAKTSVMHAVSHDLRLPVERLAAVADGLSDRNLSDDERDRLVQTLRRETSEVERMVDDLLDLSRIEAGATNPQPDWCDLGEIVAGAADRVRSERGQFEVKLKLPADLPLVKADPTQVERVFCNLLENAAKFSPGERPVEVRGICANGRVTIRVLDHGSGIPPAQQSQVFRAFVRGSEAESGSGLGLAICRGFVEANGGRITLQSGARDGSAFAVSFPATSQPTRVH